ncbi:cleft lip and palate transmembrane protein 1 homolog [Zootermopsis nevadensis]|uniref:cleft lip and palate transmembrane protein 1 homolog n=1 Tax=Zootermopsis nevadensis TaxID=136037 RepID=UPI000B8E8741|nr:cleft lip and palate transmembrane protein 1 homolog [Zootermopsis nevadensis]
MDIENVSENESLLIMADDGGRENCYEDGEQIDTVNSNEQNVPDSTWSQENDSAVEVAQEQEGYQPSKLESIFAVVKTLVMRGIVIYVIASFFQKPASVEPVPGGTVSTKLPAFNIFKNGTVMDLYVYLSESEKFNNFSDPEALIWSEKGIVYGDWNSGSNNDGTRVQNIEFKVSEAVQNNGSIYLHVYFTRRGKSPDPSSGKGMYSPHHMAYSKKLLNKYKRLRYTKTHNLLTGETAATLAEVKRAEILKEEFVSHWHPNLTLNLVTDQTNWIEGSVPPPLDEYIEFIPGGDHYKPVIYFNDFWNMFREYQPINKTTTTLELSLTSQPLSLFKWQIYSAHAMRNKWTVNWLGDTFVDEDDEEQDSLKEALLETSPYLLTLTILVSILHSVFELLAFKNDIQFWNNQKSLEGLSVRSVFFSVFQSLIVLLYVLDSDTNTVNKLTCFVGLCTEVWKIQKVVDISIDYEARIFGFIPRIRFSDKGSYIESSTKQYDMLAFHYLSWALYPLLAGYAVYSLFYQEHRGWYSFVLNMLYGSLLTFGFIMMTPQLFINYKLKSVAHMP